MADGCFPLILFNSFFVLTTPKHPAVFPSPAMARENRGSTQLQGLALHPWDAGIHVASCDLQPDECPHSIFGLWPAFGIKSFRQEH